MRYLGDWDELYFRDYLLSHPNVVEEYGKLKLNLKQSYEHDRDGYTNAKTDFIKKATKLAKEEVRKMKIIYSCDLHGDINKYEALKKLTSLEAYDAVIIGGDLLKYTSKHVNMQIEFVRNYLTDFLRSLHIPVYLIKGNTDCLPAYNILQSSASSNVNFLNQKPTRVNDKLIFGFDLINSSPFKIKNYERRDLLHDNVVFSPLLTRMDNGELQIKPADYLNTLPSIEEELSKYKDISSNIFVCHVPPFGTKLDVDNTRTHVGSKAVYECLLQRQPLLMLCGHIHESPEYSNNYLDYIGKTICVNPGQGEDFRACAIQIGNDTVLDCKVLFAK